MFLLFEIRINPQTELLWFVLKAADTDADQSRAVRKVLQRVRQEFEIVNIHIESYFLADRFRFIGGLDWSVVKPLRTLEQILTVHDGHGRTHLVLYLLVTTAYIR